MKSSVLFLALAAAVGFSASAFAGGDHHEPTPPPSSAQGGTGIGVGVGVGLGVGVAHAAGGNATGGNASAVGQGGQGGIGVGGSAIANGTVTSRVQQDQSLTTSVATGATTATNAGNNVSVQGDSYRLPASTAYAPPVAPTAMCMGAASAGIQVASFGVSGGGSFTSESCVQGEAIRRTSEVLHQPLVAAEMQCATDPIYKAARARLAAVGQGHACLVEGEAKPAPKVSTAAPADRTIYLN